jgi:RimJ/RimL family protein N-acetyltransferase
MIETARLVLRPPEAGDFDALHGMWSDADAMRELGPIKTREDSSATIARHDGYRASHGLGFWSTVRRDDGAVIGFCGLKPGAPDTPADGELEIGWMIARACWGQGYAREAAAASLAWGWANRDAPRIVAITAATNLASRTLMTRLGLSPFAAFDHPIYPPGDRLRPSVACQIARP